MMNHWRIIGREVLPRIVGGIDYGAERIVLAKKGHRTVEWCRMSTQRGFDGKPFYAPTMLVLRRGPADLYPIVVCQGLGLSNDLLVEHETKIARFLDVSSCTGISVEYTSVWDEKNKLGRPSKKDEDDGDEDEEDGEES